MDSARLRCRIAAKKFQSPENGPAILHVTNILCANVPILLNQRYFLLPKARYIKSQQNFNSERPVPGTADLGKLGKLEMLGKLPLLHLNRFGPPGKEGSGFPY